MDGLVGIKNVAQVVDDHLLRVREVMQMLGVSRSTAYRMMNDGTLPVVRFGGKSHCQRTTLRVRQSSLVQWMADHESPSAGSAGHSLRDTY